MNVRVGCATISSPNGNLLFYTDGATIWNQSHNVMANGSGLLGNTLGVLPGYCAQPALIVKQPGSNNIYYVFTNGTYTAATGLRYSVVDMSLAAGMGSVTTKNILLNNPNTEKLTSVKHCNGQDVWIVSHDWNSNNFRSYLLSSSGISTPVITPLGTVHTYSDNIWVFRGCMKASPNGKKLGIAIENADNNPTNGFELYDFDNTTGVVSNSLQLTNATDAYACEFSADGTKFYGLSYHRFTVNTNNYKTLHQWNLCNSNNTQILASHYIDTVLLNDGYLQLAPDHKIYFGNLISNFLPNVNHSLSVINYPNLPAQTSGYSLSAISIGYDTSDAGLPNFVTSYFRQAQNFTHNYSLTGNCLTATFAAVPCPYASQPVQQVHWFFGDPASGNNNVSTLQNPTHIYPAPGNYSAQCIIQYNCYTDTLKQIITINNFAPPLQIAGNQSLCIGQSLSLTASGASSYTWSNGSNNPVLVLSPSVSTIYTVSALGSPSNYICPSTQSVAITVNPLPTVTASADRTLICNGESLHLSAQGANNYTWFPINFTGPTVYPSPTISTTYTVNGADNNGCEANSNIRVIVSYCANVGSEMYNDPSLIFYPNPSNGHLTIKVIGKQKVELLTLQGTIVYETTIENESCILNLEEFVNQFLILKSTTESGSKYYRLSVSK